MVYLKRLNVRPSLDGLSPADARYLRANFDEYAGEVIVNGQVAVPWDAIDEVEVVQAPRVSGPAGWLVRHLIHGDERYHVGIYSGRDEAVLPNVTLSVAQYIVQAIAFYAPHPVRYKGLDGLAPLTDT